jgi:hypothetical protein
MSAPSRCACTVSSTVCFAVSVLDVTWMSACGLTARLLDRHLDDLPTLGPESEEKELPAKPTEPADV